MSQHTGMALRPYQLLCAVCSLGEDSPEGKNKRIEDILVSVRKAPDMPITLKCNAGDVFVYQDPGTADDTPESPEFNVKRDMEILYKLNLFPGCTLPARIIFHSIMETIEDISGICGYPSAASDAWKGCPKADSAAYKRGHAKGIEAVIPPRNKDEMKREKAESLKAMYKAEAVYIRPHILLCAVCQYGGGVKPPFPEDNLPELIEHILKEPDTLITMAPYADWMMCGPCPDRVPGLNACVNNRGSGGLPNQMRDLRMLQKLGITYGQTLKARDLYRRIFERIPDTAEICRIEHSKPSVWWTGCGASAAVSERYDKGRQMLMDLLGE